MFQISTGKFFSLQDRSKHDEQFYFYSNVLIEGTHCHSLPFFTVKVISIEKSVKYQVDYVLVTKVDNLIIKIGEKDFIQQFIQLWSFYFNCIAVKEQDELEFLLNQSEVSLLTTSSSKTISSEDFISFSLFITNLVNLDRNSYQSILSSISLVVDSKRLIFTNFDLAYTSLVYSLESLSQKHEKYIPVWEDYYEDSKKNLNKVFELVPQKFINKIKTILIGNKQFKLKKRLETFILKNLSEDFFFRDDSNRGNRIRKSVLKRCLNNLYQSRSSFVHTLKPLDEILQTTTKPHDYIMRFGNPHFTYHGLTRLIKEVINNYILSLPIGGFEQIDWVSKTSNRVIRELASSCWIGMPKKFDGTKPNSWFSELAKMLIPPRGITDQSKILLKIEQIFASSKKEFKPALFHYYVLYNMIFPNENGEKFVSSHKKYLGNCIHYYFIIAYKNLSFKWINSEKIEEQVDLDDFNKVFSQYNKTKFHKNKLFLHGDAEVLILAAAANLALDNSDIPKFKEYISTALTESGGKSYLVHSLSNSLTKTTHVEIKSLFGPNAKFIDNNT
jgi:hypothetical protein